MSDRCLLGYLFILPMGKITCFYPKRKPRISLPLIRVFQESGVFLFLAYPTGISVNPTGARKCRLT